MTPARAAAVALTVLLGLFLVSVLVVSKARRAVADLPVYHEVTPFQLTDHLGRPFGKAQLNDRLHVVDFIFTSCPDACPAMSTQMKQLYRAFEGSDKVRFLSISVDPDNDTQEVLDGYARTLGVDDERWLFLRGPIEEVQVLSEKGFLLAASDLPMGHSTRFALVDGEGQIRGYYEAFDEKSMKTLKTHLRELVREP